MSDLIIFSGQSNMEGSTAQSGYLKASKCYEYKYLIDEIVELKDPVGEDIGIDLFCAPVNGCGSLVPAFCNAYAKKNGGIVGVHCAKGNTSIADWKPGMPRYELLVQKVQRAIIKTNEKFGIGKKYFVWLQGESDALLKNSEEMYLKSLIELKNALKFLEEWLLYFVKDSDIMKQRTVSPLTEGGYYAELYGYTEEGCK